MLKTALLAGRSDGEPEDHWPGSEELLQASPSASNTTQQVTAGSTGIYSVCASQLPQGRMDMTTHCNCQIVGRDTKKLHHWTVTVLEGEACELCLWVEILSKGKKTKQGRPLPYDSSWW